MDEKVQCPLMGELIDTGICFDIHMFLEDAAPEWTVPKKILTVPEYKEICIRCPNHRDD